MVAVNTVVEVIRDGAWVPGIVIEESTYRLVVALNGEHSHRAYIARITANWRTVPKNANHARDPQRRKALKQAHNIFARAQ